MPMMVLRVSRLLAFDGVVTTSVGVLLLTVVDAVCDEMIGRYDSHSLTEMKNIDPNDACCRYLYSSRPLIASAISSLEPGSL